MTLKTPILQKQKKEDIPGRANESADEHLVRARTPVHESVIDIHGPVIAVHGPVIVILGPGPIQETVVELPPAVVPPLTPKENLLMTLKGEEILALGPKIETGEGPKKGGDHQA
jgi:hypothetical protein